jgi:hypothetical protein
MSPPGGPALHHPAGRGRCDVHGRFIAGGWKVHAPARRAKPRVLARSTPPMWPLAR